MLRSERDHAVGDRELRRRRHLLAVVLADPEAHAADRRGRARQLVQEASVVTVVGRIRRQRLEAVDDHEARAPLAHQRLDPLQDGREAAAGEVLAEVLVDDAGADRRHVEEGHRLAEAHDLVERLGHRREVQRRPLRGAVREGVALRQDRLAAARDADDEVDRVHGEPAREHAVETRDPAREALDHAGERTRACVSALVPSRSRTVDSSTTGSTGFWRNASAPRAAEMSPAASGEIATTSAPDA